MEKTLILLLLVLVAVTTAQIKFKMPKPVHNPFSWRLQPLTGGGKPNGLTGTGTFKTRNSGNTFTGTGSWQNGKGFGGSLTGSFGIGRGSSISVGFGGGGGEVGKAFKANVGLKIKFRRKRRSALVRELFHV